MPVDSKINQAKIKLKQWFQNNTPYDICNVFNNGIEYISARINVRAFKEYKKLEKTKTSALKARMWGKKVNTDKAKKWQIKEPNCFNS